MLKKINHKELWHNGMIIKVLKRKKGKGYITTEFLKNAKNHSCCIFFIVFLGSTATSFFSRPAGRFRIWCHLSSLFSANWLGDEAGVHFQAFEGVQFASTSSHFKPMEMWEHKSAVNRAYCLSSCSWIGRHSRSSKNYLLFLKTASITHIISTNRKHAKSIFTIGKVRKTFAAEDVVGEVDGGDPANRF